MAILTVGIDLAKNVFAVHGVNESGTAQLRQPKVARAKLNALIAALPPCMMASKHAPAPTTGRGSSRPNGHTDKLMAPSSLRPTA